MLKSWEEIYNYINIIQKRLRKMSESKVLLLSSYVLFMLVSTQRYQTHYQTQLIKRQDQISLTSATCPDILGCARCDSDGNCFECVDKQLAIHSYNVCSCYYQGASFRSDGTCGYCLVPGCKFCEEDYYISYTCVQCHESSTLVDGKCVCEKGKHFDWEGKCEDCPVTIDGQCQLCSFNNCFMCYKEQECAFCTDPQWAAEVDGQCECRFHELQFNENGYCALCYVIGCKTCKGDKFQSWDCAECIDPQASISYGKCVCPQESQQFNAYGYCQSCPDGYVLQHSICVPTSCQDSITCETCIDGICTECKNPNAYIYNNDCHCPGKTSVVNDDGFCGSCLVLGCQTCQFSDYFYSFTCISCVPSSHLVKGKCVCPDGEFFLGDACSSHCPYQIIANECRQCALDHCQSCQGETCYACIDPLYSEIVDGKCVCKYDLTFNEAGYCGRCRVIGCRTCKADHFQSFSCSQCINPNLSIVNGKCVCPVGQTIHEDGGCYPCNVFGCEVCKRDDANVCEKCAAQAIINDEGQCQCSGKNMALTKQGSCSPCLVIGCRSCEQDNYFACATCMDEENTKKQWGQCICLRGQRINDDGYCQECNIVGCSSCRTGDSYVCERCQSGFYLQDGSCECTSLEQKINEKGKCSRCSVLGCQSCFSFDGSECRSCYEGAQLLHNQCMCDKGAPNQKGRCSSCLVSACVSCSSDNPYHCLQCSSDFTLVEGICQCRDPNSKINVQGVCEGCLVEGCQSCQVGNPSRCAKCFDCAAFLIDGACFCPETWVHTLQHCTTAAIANSESSSVRSKQQCPENCQVCDNGKCSRCGEEFYFRQQENKCMECNPRCKSCRDGVSCIQHQQGWTTTMGKIVHCEVLHCADCSQAAQKCEKCRQNYLLLDGFRCQVDPSHPDVDEDMGNFSEFKRKYEKTYASEQEEKKREQIYYRNYEEMKDLKKIVPFQVGETKFLDLTKEEMKKRSGYSPEKISEQKYKGTKPKLSTAWVAQFDWRDKGGVSSVKDQGACGSCWAFAVAAGTESALIIRKYEQIGIDLSEQYLVECGPGSGCDGSGDMDGVLELTIQGMPLEQTYPYNYSKEYPGICQAYEKISTPLSFFKENYLSDEEMMDRLRMGPLMVAISAEGWSSYKGGILQCEEDAEIDHEVLLVGYTEDYWVVKNSWGDDWGEQGFIRIGRSKYYNCLINSQVHGFSGYPCERPGCSICSSDNICINCQPDALLSGGECHCVEAGYVFSEWGYCVPCTVFACRNCLISNPYVCEVCQENMVVGANGSCECATPSHKPTKQQTCVLCEVLGCEFCQSGKQNSCIKCSDCSAYLHEGKCACKEGYVMNSQGECIRRACLYPSVVENGVCKCPASFVQIGQSCRNCSEYGCVKCSSLDQINVKCETCEEGKGLEDGACVACGYGAKKYGEVCVQCLVQGCAFCALDNVCEQCLPGWVSKQNICVECPPGQYEAHGICSSCHPNCAQCRKYASSCTACTDGKYLFASACISCRHGCSYCSPLNPTICLACADGYFLDRNLCYQCPKGCSTCSSDYNCSSCAAPYVLSGISCVIPCVFPCWTCQQDTPTSCLSCFDGYKLESSSCVLDVSCNDTSTCTGCSPTYYLTQEGKCQSCPQYCRTCPNQVCSQCVEGFDLFAQECVKEGSYSFKGNEQLSKQINTNPRLKRKFQQILKSK